MGRISERSTIGGGLNRFTLDDPLLAATADRIVYLCRKGVVNHNQAYWQLNDLLREGHVGLTDRDLLELDLAIRGILDHCPTSRCRSESTIVAARVPRRMVERLDDFASAYQLTRSQCLGLALDLVYGQEWQLETEPWKRTKHIYGGQTLPALLSQLERGATKGGHYGRSRGRSISRST